MEDTKKADIVKAYFEDRYDYKDDMWEKFYILSDKKVPVEVVPANYTGHETIFAARKDRGKVSVRIAG